MSHFISTVRALAAALFFTVCVAGSAVRAQDFPVTIDHAFGSTVISQKPQRVATVGWANHEVPLALGVVPVGMARTGFGDDDGDGIMPWVAARLKELGAEAPPLFDEGDGVDFEAVAATRPDVILAAYSGLSQSDYDILSQIAPVVAYPEGRWTTDWRSMMRQNGAGMGMADAAADLIRALETRIDTARAAYQNLQGKSAMFVTHLNARDLSVIRFYSANDTRVKFFEDLGLVSPQAVVDASANGSYSGEVSAERIDDFADVDIIVTYGDQDLIETLSSNALVGRMGAVENGSIVLLGNDPMENSANPTPLGIPWMLDHYLAELSKAAMKAE